jgi:hypothetical protein
MLPRFRHKTSTAEDAVQWIGPLPCRRPLPILYPQKPICLCLIMGSELVRHAYEVEHGTLAALAGALCDALDSGAALSNAGSVLVCYEELLGLGAVKVLVNW